jgi:hypothetical protein
MALHFHASEGQWCPLMEIKMTFEQFQASRRYSEDIGTAISDARWEGEPSAKGYLYLDGLYIEEVQPHWPEAAKARGKWYLLIDRDDWITDDLEALERKLYDWAASEGYFEGNDSIDTELNSLTSEYKAWNKAQGLNLGSADEHLFDENLTAEQRKWLRDFSQRWEGASPVLHNGVFVRQRDVPR